MHITRLRLLGFKSFVEATDLLIEPGLTGVVGPNGCGKSNLLEALRWVMGETSYKSMRGSAMDDVIFAGTDKRPARDMAEVTIYLDNSRRTAPSAFNDTDSIEISRRIQREAGSIYKVNGREARARDVQLLFADAATGARSQALVQQGRIGEIVNAKPEQRRRILEDAAGIAGLHGRRHEAELRLKAAEANMERMSDVMSRLSSQLQGLKRQARQARRYKELSQDLRRAEALQLHLAVEAASAKVRAEETDLHEAMRTVGQLTQAESAALRAEADGSDALQPLREEEAIRAAVLHRLEAEQQTLEREEARALARRDELSARLVQIDADIEREQDLITEAQELGERLEREHADLEKRDGDAGMEAAANEALAAARSALEEAEAALSALTSEAADLRARRRENEAQLTAFARRSDQLRTQQETTRQALADLNAELGGDSETVRLSAAVERLAGEIADIEAQTERAEETLAASRAQEKTAREAASQTSLNARQLETEVATLIKLLRPAEAARWRPVVDDIRVSVGYETALGAALGDDLDLPADTSAPAHWGAGVDSGADAPLPAGARPFTEFVRAPDVLTRRLAQIGLVEREDGERLARSLKPGQRLVTLAGDLWRWDGMFAAGDAPSASAKRLTERNRLDELSARCERLSSDAREARELAEAAQARLAQAQAEERRLRDLWRATNGELARTRDALTHAERATQQLRQKRAVLSETQERLAREITELEAQADKARQDAAGLPDTGELEARLGEVQTGVAARRDAYSEAKSVVDGIMRERRLRTERLEVIRAESERALKRLESGRAQIAALGERGEETRSELAGLADIPEQVAARRERLLSELSQAEARRREAADQLANAENALKDNARALREAQSRLSDARERRARIEAQLEAARQRRQELARSIRETLDCQPDECLQVAQHPPGEPLPALEEIEARITQLRAERERLGGVNLRAEEEVEQLGAEVETLERERADLDQAIAKLRHGITTLNREGRKRLMDAFEVVNGHFQHLFGVLFAGGEARLELIESDDPLESGLEIIARPPGKKPQVLTLLSGGEKALTALALIFAVFLTNPSPICVLDEVDAPLDDANVDRFCAMMDDMSRSTETRFLVITHHPMTMSRMNRLFGVTMAEKGVSQLVSVDLQTAERFMEAG